jgi:hypothetical protein
VALGLFQLLLLEGRHTAVVVLAGVLGVLGKLLERLGLLGDEVFGGAAHESQPLHLLFQLVDPNRERVRQCLGAHLLGVVFQESEFRVGPALCHVWSHLSGVRRKTAYCRDAPAPCQMSSEYDGRQRGFSIT